MLLFCWISLSLFMGNSFADTIQPLSSEQHIFRGDSVTLSCNYSGFVNNLQWYRKHEGSKPEFLIIVNENSESQETSLRLSAKDSKDKKQVNLTISSAEVSDSALYYCALRPTVTERAETLYKNLIQSCDSVLTDFTVQFDISKNNQTPS